MLEAIQEAHHINMNILQIEGDSQQLIGALSKYNISSDWEIQGITSDSRYLLQFFEDWFVRKIHRSQNRCAHELAQWAAFNHHNGNLPLSTIPPSLLKFHSGKDPPSL